MYYKIKIIDLKLKNRCWVGHSNASNGFGFYLTFYKNGKIFSNDTFESSYLADWLENGNYNYEKILIEESMIKRRDLY